VKGPALTIALPSKGRIEQDVSALFTRAGLLIERESGAREYKGRLQGIPEAEVLFLASSEIPEALESGAVHLGITGLDLIREYAANAEGAIITLAPLGFGRADVVVAVPRAWIDVATMADLAEVALLFRARHHRNLRVATKYARLTRAFFASFGIRDFRIVESAGATEAAPASGFAEIIVDITTTGATLKANSLKVPTDGLILRSEAVLAASRKASWQSRVKTALRRIVTAIDGAREKSAKEPHLTAHKVDALFERTLRVRQGARPPLKA
jgi:ATP phosphoribosyltransferase